MRKALCSQAKGRTTTLRDAKKLPSSLRIGPEEHELNNYQTLTATKGGNDRDLPLRVRMMLGGRAAKATLDSRASANYIALGVVQKLGLETEAKETLHYMNLANGTK